MAQSSIRRVAVHHRVHVAAGDAEEHPRLAKRLEGLGRLPVRLRNDADAEPVRFEQPPDDRHAEARMVDVGVPGYQHDIAGIPAERIHLGAAHRQERGRLAGTRRLTKPRHQGLFGGREVIHAATHKTPGRQIQPAHLLRRGERSSSSVFLLAGRGVREPPAISLRGRWRATHAPVPAGRRSRRARRSEDPATSACAQPR